MVREISAGGVVIRQISGAWNVAVIEPCRDAAPPTPTKKPRSQSCLLALPKGLVDVGEKPAQAAIREVEEETGVKAVVIAKLADIKYFYVRSWSDRERVFKIVSFYLLAYESGRIDEISAEMRIEVRRALWLPLDEALQQLSYKSERDVVRRAQEYLKSHPEV